MEELRIMVPLKDYTELVAGKATAEAELKHLESERLNLVGQIYDLKHQIAGMKDQIASMKGDDLK